MNPIKTYISSQKKILHVRCDTPIWNKTKITTHAVTFDAKEKQTLCRRLAECFDALGAQYLLDQAALLHYRNLLEVGLKRAIGCMLGE